MSTSRPPGGLGQHGKVRLLPRHAADPDVRGRNADLTDVGVRAGIRGVHVAILSAAARVFTVRHMLGNDTSQPRVARRELRARRTVGPRGRWDLVEADVFVVCGVAGLPPWAIVTVRRARQETQCEHPFIGYEASQGLIALRPERGPCTRLDAGALQRGSVHMETHRGRVAVVVAGYRSALHLAGIPCADRILYNRDTSGRVPRTPLSCPSCALFATAAILCEDVAAWLPYVDDAFQEWTTVIAAGVAVGGTIGISGGCAVGTRGRCWASSGRTPPPGRLIRLRASAGRPTYRGRHDARRAAKNENNRSRGRPRGAPLRSARQWLASLLHRLNRTIATRSIGTIPCEVDRAVRTRSQLNVARGS